MYCETVDIMRHFHESKPESHTDYLMGRRCLATNISLCTCTKKSHGLPLTRPHCIEMSPMQCVLNVVFCTQRIIKTSWYVMMDVVLGTMLNAHILKEKGKIIFVRTVCKLKFKVLIVQVSICGSLYSCVFYNVSYSVRCLILHSEQ